MSSPRSPWRTRRRTPSPCGRVRPSSFSTPPGVSKFLVGRPPLPRLAQTGLPGGRQDHCKLSEIAREELEAIQTDFHAPLFTKADDIPLTTARTDDELGEYLRYLRTVFAVDREGRTA